MPALLAGSEISVLGQQSKIVLTGLRNRIGVRHAHLGGDARRLDRGPEPIRLSRTRSWPWLSEPTGQSRYRSKRRLKIRGFAVDHVPQKRCIVAGRAIIGGEPADRPQSFSNRIFALFGKLMTVSLDSRQVRRPRAWSALQTSPRPSRRTPRKESMALLAVAQRPPPKKKLRSVRRVVDAAAKRLSRFEFPVATPPHRSPAVYKASDRSYSGSRCRNRRVRHSPDRTETRHATGRW